jgi:hypothetical protein
VVPYLTGADDLKRFSAAVELHKLSLGQAMETYLWAPRESELEYAGILVCGEGAPMKACIIADMECNKCATLMRDIRGLQHGLEGRVELRIVSFPRRSSSNGHPIAEALMVVGLAHGAREFLDAFSHVSRDAAVWLNHENVQPVLRGRFGISGEEFDPLFEDARRQIQTASTLYEHHKTLPLLCIDGRIIRENISGVLLNLGTMLEQLPTISTKLRDQASSPPRKIATTLSPQDTPLETSL